MIMDRKVRWFAMVFPCSLIVVSAVHAFSPEPLPFMQNMHEIAASQELAADQKIEAIAAHFDTVPVAYWGEVIGHLHRIDRHRAKDIVLSRFRNPESSRAQKLHLGRYLYTTLIRDDPSDETNQFSAEYRAFIIDAVIHGGVEEFSKPNSRDTITAVDEYSRILSDQKYPNRKLYLDERIIPVLIQCLSAPDHVYDEVDVNPPNILPGEEKKLGDPSGSNTQRERIPILLAELKATAAIPALENIAFSHHDQRLRENAVGALEILKEINRLKEPAN